MKRIISVIMITAITLTFFALPVSATATLKINWKSITIGLGETYKLTAITNSTKTITWSSSDKAIITVDKNGNITGAKTGKATVTAKTDGVAAECKVTVKKAPDKISAKDITVEEGAETIIETTLPSGSACKTFKYKSSDTKIAKVDSNGKTAGVKTGTCKITITTYNGKSTDIKVTVKAGVIFGNTAGNLSNGGFLAQSGDWIYYSNCNDMRKLYKMKPDGTGNKKLCDDNQIEYINIIGDRIYYAADESIISIKTDGTGRKKILDEFADNIIAAGDWIYYQKGNPYQDDGIYKIKTDGTQKTKLCNGKTHGAEAIIGGWIYYRSRNTGINDKNYVYKIKIDGTEKTQLFEADGFGFVSVVGDWIYYRLPDYYKDKGIYKIKIDGTGKQTIYSGAVSNINVSGDWIYYSNTDFSGGDNGLYKN